ncbi:MAG: hypothetical protein R3211_03665 [Balneolaceae bacterium]|nr:hypothetical protein [Balneolaceae bacterium]
MKIGIVGPADRAVAWEQHLRPHHSVTEVVIAAHLKDIGSVDGCLIMDDTDRQLEIVLEALQKGCHAFLISRLPTDTAKVEKAYHAAEESDIVLQFSHWPTFAPASQWMYSKIRKPNFIQVIREISHTHFMEMKYDLEYYWIDELAFCLKWIDGIVHHIDIKSADIGGDDPSSIQIFLRFDSGATSGIFVTTCAAENRHKRVAADHTFLVDCDVLQQHVRLGEANESGHLFFKKESFDPSTSAEIAVTQFLKAIQMNKPTLFSGYDALRVCKVVDKIRNRIARV